jgi:hypothetical protein
MAEYVQIPKQWLADQSTAKAWIGRSLDWVASLAPKARPKNLKATSRRSSSSRSTKKAAPRRG